MKKNSYNNSIPDLDKKVEETLEILSGLDRTGTDPFFFSRLEERMNRREESSLFRFLNSWPVPMKTAFYTLLILFAVNTASVIHFSTLERSVDSELDAFADEYGFYTGDQIYEAMMEE